MAQDDCEDPQLRAIAAGLGQDYPRLHAKLARSGLLFVAARLTIAVGGLALAAVLLMEMNGLGIGATYFAVILMIIGVTEAARRAIQLASLIKGHRRSR
ncbi:hypothetical protein [Streptomyces gibsoniae]|uniref:DUF3040 domain-containing protein n=1 Tax=Streptomyces gibsoniae TaxID=3075529 RepID=A0ABU2TWX5_9ACTN|nr:hypothetical protein [Streptomyces sp. DSM 41699]MDT0465345.1 hypothetical protein [Streptomyces sp. DSM 41699]